MRADRRRVCLGAVALPLSAASWSVLANGSYPQQPIKLVLPYAAGGGPDVLTRRLAEKLGAIIGQPVFVENKVGAGGMLAAEYVAQARADGYTLLLGASTHVTQKLLSPSARFDPLMQFVHITRTSIAPSVLIVSSSSPFKHVRDLIAAAKASPGKLNFSSGGIGSAAHLSGAALATATGMDVAHIPYKGSVEIVPSILSGDTQFAFPIISTALPFIAQGKVRALALTSAKRTKQLDGVPTLREVLGKDELVLDAWSGIWAPANTPPPIVNMLNAAILKALADPQLRSTYESVGSPVSPTTSPQEFTQFVLAETAKYAKLVVTSRLSTQ